MIKHRIEKRPSFVVTGVKTWIGGTDGNEAFGHFWDECKSNGILDELSKISGGKPGSETGAMFLGLSAVDKDPSNREFDFYVAVEGSAGATECRFECYAVPAATWAVFRTTGAMPDALVEAEIHAFRDWLPGSGYVHANAPELEVYPPSQLANGMLVEFWLPVTAAGQSGRTTAHSVA